MLIEIYGAGFANKGAQLMLETTIDKIRMRHPEARFAINAGIDRPPVEVHRLGANFIWPSGSFYSGGKVWTLDYYKKQFKNACHRFAKPKKLNAYGLVSRKQVDAFVDISGYSFGDFWGANPLHHVLSVVEFYKRAGKPVIFLPQMLGPFEKQDVRDLFHRVAMNASQIYAREQSSFEEATAVAPDIDIKIAPDITIFSSQAGTEQYSPDTTRVCIVPNIRMTDSGKSPISKADYIRFLAACVRQIAKAGLKPVLVVHETFGADAELAKAVQEQLQEQKVELFSNPDPKVLKSFIGESRFLIGSRFHSLVAALSQGVPVVALGWAHKYSQLLNDFDVPEFNLKDIGAEGPVKGLVQALVEDTGCKEASQRIKVARERLEISNTRMWEDVFRILEIA